MQPDNHDGDEPDIDWRRAVEPWLKKPEEWREGPGSPPGFDDEARADLVFKLLKAALEAGASKDEDAQSRYITEAESLVQTIGQVEDFTLVWGLGDLLRRIGRPADAVEYLLSAVNLAAGSTTDEETLAQIHIDLHYCYEDLHQYDLAEPWGDKWAEWAERATRPGGGHEADAPLCFQLGGYYFCYGKYELAAEKLESAERSGLEADALSVARQERAYALETMGRWEEAIPIWKELVEQEEYRQFATHFAEMLGYARGRLDVRLRRRHRPGCPDIVWPGEGDQGAQGIDSADKPPHYGTKTDSREHVSMRLAMVQVGEDVKRHIDQRLAESAAKKLEDIKRELRETLSSETWMRFDAKTQDALASGKLLYQEYGFVDSFDVGRVGLYFTAALETELRFHVLGPFQAWLETKKVSKIKVGNKNPQSAEVGMFGLGETMHLLNRGGRGECPEIQQWVKAKAPEAETFLLKELPLRLPRVVHSRNVAAHAGSLTKTQLDELHREIVGSREKPGLLKQLLDAMRAKGSEQ